MVVVMGRRLYISLIAMMLLSFIVCEQATAQIVRSTPKRETSTKQTKPKTTTTNKTNKTTSKKTNQRTRSTGSSNRSSVTTPSSSAANSSTVYDVTFTCNMEDADLYIDNAYMGYANGTYNIKGGTHYIHVVADGCDDYTATINVSSSRRSFKLTMNNDVSQPLHTLLDDMVFVQGGSFIMGAKENTGAEYDEMPAHEVKLSSFYICKYEVTQDLWIEVMGNNPSENVDESLPVESITWDDCQMFIKKLNAMTGIKFRLPTEAEWEFAARGGIESHGYKYAGMWPGIMILMSSHMRLGVRHLMSSACMICRAMSWNGALTGMDTINRACSAIPQDPGMASIACAAAVSGRVSPVTARSLTVSRFHPRIIAVPSASG